MKIQGRGGGTTPSDIINVTWSNIRLETEYHAPRWWGNGEWLGISLLPRQPGDSVGTARQLRFINITGRSENGGLLSSLQEGGLHDVLFENVHIKIATWSNYSRSAAGGKTGPVGPGWIPVGLRSSKFSGYGATTPTPGPYESNSGCDGDPNQTAFVAPSR